MKAEELRKKYLEFFESNGHALIPGASLIPENDPTVLFTTAGMHPLVPFLLGEKHPAGKKLTDVQKCVRTGDIESVGDNWHLTFFEMLGNWSLGDYWKKEAISWSFEFLTGKKFLAIPLEKLNITVFEGDKDAKKDEESAKIWRDLGIPKERIFYLPKDDNWWGPAGETGPCGPCTEMFYDKGLEKCGKGCKPGCHCGKYVEIWNDVFMEFNKAKTGKYEPLKQKNVDTGMGLERTIAILSGENNVYDTELFLPIIQEIKSLSNIEKFVSEIHEKGVRIVADHIKTAVFISAEGLEPSNVERGYVLRRLIRRAVRRGKELGIQNIFTHKIAETVIEIYQNVYPELLAKKDFILEQLTREEEKFEKTLGRGLVELEKMVAGLSGKKEIKGEDAFYIYETFGFPLEMIEEEVFKKGFKVDKEGFKTASLKHQELSRTGSEKKFKGGLADHSEKTTKYHTATHLLLAALRKLLGDNIFQKGSNITAERLRFDFSYPEKLTKEQLIAVENLVNEKIKQGLEVECQEMPLEDAKKQGAMGVFGEKYGDRVKVYSIFDKKTGEVFSKEICGGPHAKNTLELGEFKILKEESSGAGVRRIKAIL